MMKYLQKKNTMEKLLTIPALAHAISLAIQALRLIPFEP
jgi:hypothetical protein